MAGRERDPEHQESRIVRTTDEKTRPRPLVAARNLWLGRCKRSGSLAERALPEKVRSRLKPSKYDSLAWSIPPPVRPTPVSQTSVTPLPASLTRKALRRRGLQLLTP